MPTNNEPFEEMLNQRPKHFISFLETTPDFVYSKDLDNRFLFSSQSLAKISGHSSWQDMIGKTDYDCFPNETALIDREEEATIFKKGKPLIDKVHFFYDEFGNEEWLSTNKWPLKNDQGKVVGLFGISRNITKQKHFLDELKKSEEKFRKPFMTGLDAFYTSSLEYISGTIKDITEQKKIEEQQKENQARIELVMKSASILLWEMDLATGYVKSDSRVLEKLGYKSENFTKKNDYIALLHPDDLERCTSAMDNHIKGLIDKFELEFRIRTNKGDYKWFYNLGTINKRDETGAAISIAGIIIDTSETKRSEKSIDDTNRRFRTIFEDAPLGIALIDLLTGAICDANPMFAKITGRSVVELVNTTWMNITHPDDIQFDFDKKELLVNGKIDKFQMEKRFIRPDDSIVWVNMTISRMIKEENIPLYHLCMIEDITERKLMEKKMKNIAWHQSHQVRGPLTTIMGIIAAMNFKITLEEKLALLGRLDEAANKLDTAVRTIVGETTPPKI